MKALADYLQSRDRFYILTHVRPDGDTLGSAAALCVFLRSLGKSAAIAPNPEITPRYMPFVAPYLGSEEPPDGACLVAVDTASRELIPEPWRNLPIDCRIDHHPNQQPYALYEYTEPERAACGEVLFCLAAELGLAICPETARLLYLALSTDTGCFRYANTTAESHRIAAALIDTGIDRFALDHMVFLSRSRARAAVECAVLNAMRYRSEGRVAIAMLTQAALLESGATEDDLEGYSSLPLSIEGVMVGISLREGQNGCKLSVRTAAPYAANRLCALLGGGGHERAAGATLEGGLGEALETVLETLRRLYPELAGG